MPQWGNSWCEGPSLRAKRSNPFCPRSMVDCFASLAMTEKRFLQRPAFALWASARTPRPSGYDAAAFACFATTDLGVACRAVAAKQAKAGGARRDRTADLLHAMQALSQLSYGPE